MKFTKTMLSVSLAAGLTLVAGATLAHDGTNEAGTPVCLEANYMVANAMNAPFAAADGPGEVIEQNIITGERGITVVNPFSAANAGNEICPPEMECPGPWKPTGTFSGGMNGHSFITSAGQQALTEFQRDGTPIRTVSYRPLLGNPTGPAGRGSLPRPLGTQIMPNGNLVQAICDANFFNAQNSDPILDGEDDPGGNGNSSNLYFPPVYNTAARAANSRILVIDQETMQVIDEYSQPPKWKWVHHQGWVKDPAHDLWGCAAGIVFDSDYMYLSTFHGGAVLKVDWRAGIDRHSRGVGANKPFPRHSTFVLGKHRNRAKVDGVIDFVGGPADNPDRRDTLRAVTFDESGNVYATNRRRSRECLRGEYAGSPGGCNPSVFRQRVSIDIIDEDNGVNDEDATLALDPGVNVIAGIRINRMSAIACEAVLAEGGTENDCDVETLYVSASAMNPGEILNAGGCVGGNPANACFKPGGYVTEYRIDRNHLDGGAAWGGGDCNGDPTDPAGNSGCAQPIASFGGAINGDVNIDPRMLMPIQRAFIQ